MFLQRIPRKKGGEVYDYWALTKTVRTANGPRHQVVSYLGKLDAGDQEYYHSWDDIASLLDGRRDAVQGDLFERPKPVPEWREINVSGIEVKRVREFGQVWAALAVWRRLGLDRLFAGLMPEGREDIRWDLIACVLTAAKFCEQVTENAIAGEWLPKTALCDVLGLDEEKVNLTRMYRGLDEILAHKDAVCAHLQSRWGQWFGTRLDFMLYDVTSSYFEGACETNPLARRGYSRDNRPDCKQVCIGLVVTPDGMPVGYEVFAGNRADTTTMREIVTLMEEKYGHANRVWVTDRGMSSEENIAFLEGRESLYLMGASRGLLKRHESEFHDGGGWQAIREGLSVKLVKGAGNEKYVLCKSADRAKKEQSMLQRQLEKFRAGIEKRSRQLAGTPSKKTQSVQQGVGRLRERYPSASKHFECEVLLNEKMEACGIALNEKPGHLEWAGKTHGAYVLRTNTDCENPAELWRWYIQLTEAESAFRDLKSDLALRPIYHHLQRRAEAHILVCFLSLCLWRTLEHWMGVSGLGDEARQFLAEMRQIHSMDIHLPTRQGPTVKLRVVSRPEKQLAVLLSRMKLRLPNVPLKLEM
jgi:transposase